MRQRLRRFRPAEWGRRSVQLLADPGHAAGGNLSVWPVADRDVPRPVGLPAVHGPGHRFIRGEYDDRADLLDVSAHWIGERKLRRQLHHRLHGKRGDHGRHSCVSRFSEVAGRRSQPEPGLLVAQPNGAASRLRPVGQRWFRGRFYTKTDHQRVWGGLDGSRQRLEPLRPFDVLHIAFCDGCDRGSVRLRHNFGTCGVVIRFSSFEPYR
jgi:hypothetical protein